MKSPSGEVIRIPQSSYSCAFVSIRGPMVFLRPLGISARCVQTHWDTNGHECTRIRKELQRSERDECDRLLSDAAKRVEFCGESGSPLHRLHGRLDRGASPSNTSASKKPRMEQTESSEPLTKARFSATPKLNI